MAAQTVAIYCGENKNMTEDHAVAAAMMGRALAENGIHIVYGGTRQGLMGIIADAALQAGGKVTGVVTKAVPDERRHLGLTELIEVDDLDARKIKMTSISEASVVLPGGHGTFDELQRELTLVKFGQKNGEDINRKVIVYDPDNFFSGYLKQVAQMGKIKGDDKDARLFTFIKDDPRKVLLELGAMTAWEYAEKYSGAGAYGSFMVDREMIDDFSKPITESQRQQEGRKAGGAALIGVGAIAGAFAVAAAPVSVPLAIIGILSLLYAQGTALEAQCRPAIALPDQAKQRGA